MDRLPNFSIDDYRKLLVALHEAGYTFRTVSEMAAWDGTRTCYLRHDIDFHLVGADEMAQADAAAGVRSTFFILVAGYYNIFAEENAAIIRSIANAKHEIGLHYDLRSYPDDRDAADELLGFQAECLERVSLMPVRSIVMHEPSAGHGDYFRNGRSYVHPHSEQWNDVTYISDSCRAWRDTRLLEALRPSGPQRLLLNIHPELWRNSRIEDRIEYLETVSAPNAALHTDTYFHEYMSRIWQTHEAVRLDEERRERERHANDR